MMTKISNDELQNLVRKIDDETCDSFMDLALQDTKRLVKKGVIDKDTSKFIAAQIYATYLKGYALGSNKVNL